MVYILLPVLTHRPHMDSVIYIEHIVQRDNKQYIALNMMENHE